MTREGDEKDIKDILEIYNDAILNTTAVYTYKEQTLTDKTRWYYEKKNNGFPLLVAEENNKVIGFATFGLFRDWPAYHYTVEHSVYVNKSYRQQGIASALMKKLIKIANEQEYTTIVAAIDSDNNSSISLHKKIGFTYFGRMLKVGFKFGRWLDLDFYQLNLQGPKIPVEE